MQTLFRTLETLTMPCVWSLITFLANNLQQPICKSSTHDTNIRRRVHSMQAYQCMTYTYSKQVTNKKHFTANLWNFLLDKSLYKNEGFFYPCITLWSYVRNFNFCCYLLVTYYCKYVFPYVHIIVVQIWGKTDCF